jgi:hypothetical protein
MNLSTHLTPESEHSDHGKQKNGDVGQTKGPHDFGMSLILRYPEGKKTHHA